MFINPSSKTLTLGQNKPNPFNPTTEIRYNLSSPGNADLRIYDTHGRQVRSLVEQVEQAGEHVVVWDGRDDVGQSLASGVYYYKLNTELGSEAKRAVLLK